MLLFLMRKIRIQIVTSSLLIILSRVKLIAVMMIAIPLFLAYAYYSVADIPAKSARPNVLLISIDTLRADHLSCYGKMPVRTSPNIDRIAYEGFLFKKAYATTTWTLPSHASMMTGLFPSAHHADRSLHQTMTRPVDPLKPSAITLAEVLSENGYMTAGIISNPFVSGSFGMDQGFDFYDDRVDIFEDVRYLSLKDISMLFQVFKVLRLIDRNDFDGERRVPEVNRIAIDWLKKNRDSENPFFLFLHYNEPHFKYEPPPPYNRDIDGREIPYFDDISALNRGVFSLSTAGLNDMLVLYDGEISYLDQHLGKLFNRLDEWGLMDNTLIIITSDHGESFNEHEVWQHGNSLYEEQIRVPLIIRYPGLSAGGRVIEKQIVQTLDLMPTILDIIDIPLPQNVQGRSLVPVIRGDAGTKFNIAFAELRPDINWKMQNPRYGIGMKAVIYGDWKFILSDNGKEELYNLSMDPDESVNLVSKDKDRAGHMKRVLMSWAETFKSAPGNTNKRIEGGRLEQLRSLGYLQ
jgi:arylsulfatase A-like enzyme